MEKIDIDKDLEFETQKFFKKVLKSVAALQIREQNMYMARRSLLFMYTLDTEQSLHAACTLGLFPFHFCTGMQIKDGSIFPMATSVMVAASKISRPNLKPSAL